MDLKHLYSGKVRDLYSIDEDLLLVASDRMSVYDVVLPTRIPDKGALLTQLSVWWFGQLGEVVPNHLISATDVPPDFGRRAIRCRPLKMIPFELIARGYLAGLGLREYQASGTISGVSLPAGLREGSRLPEPVFTPTTKVSGGGHDEFVTFDELANELGLATATRLRDLTLEVYRRGAEHAAEQGVIIADTKFEFGWDATEALTLGDEVLTPDSARFWPADEWEPGRPQHAFDKQIVRDWAAGTGWNKEPPGPALPDEIVELTRRRYTEVYEKITGISWDRDHG